MCFFANFANQKNTLKNINKPLIDTDKMNAKRKTKNKIEDLIANYLQKLKWDGDPPRLYNAIAHALSQEGKRIRPNLCLYSAEMFCQDPQEAIHAAAAFELLHNFTLIHDDIMDKSPLRRGVATVYRQWGINTAILAGDTLFAKGMELLLHYKGKMFAELTELFIKTMIEICEGQQMDLDFAKKNHITQDQYMKMIHLKTAVLFGACLKAGAIVGEAAQRSQNLLYDYGVEWGIIFQIQDDLLDVYGNADSFGKSIGGDIEENKKTYLSVMAMEANGGKDKKALQACFKDASLTREEKIRKVKAIYDTLDIKRETQKKLYIESFRAERYLKDVRLDEEKKKPLREFVEKLLHREF
jgi:geranylgeranyl diphosphate synthase type II